MEQKRLKVGMIGVGDITFLHFPAYKDFEGAELHTLCDLNETLLRKRAAEWGVKRITTDRHGTIRLYYNTQNDLRNAATEHTAKWARDTWPHLLLNQTFDTLPRLRDIRRLDLRLDFQVHQLRRL